MIKIWTSIGFMAQVLLGNICMMPMAFAASLPVSHEEHMEMVMTPVIPMSPLHCDYCVTLAPVGGGMFSGMSSCAGHCLSQTSIPLVGTIVSGTSQSIAPAFSMISFVEGLHDTVFVLRAMAPSLVLHVDTTVLML